MQNAATTTATHPGHLAQPWSNPSHMYPNSSAHQRNATNPRAYDTGTGAQAGDDQYASYQQAAGFGVGGVGYNYQSGINSLYNTSPSLASASRRTSNPKASSPATATSTVGGATTSPSAYYPRQPAAAVDAQSPYQQTSNPSQVLGHHQQGVSQQQYGYYPYYDQHSQHSGQGGQWPQHYNAQSNYSQQQVQPRQTSSGSMTSGAAVNASDSGRQSGSTFDYASTGGQQSYQSWDSGRGGGAGHQWQQQQAAGQQTQQTAGQQQSSTAQRGSASSTSAQSQPSSVVSPWQGYGNHHPFPPPPQPVPQMGGQLPPGPGQYGGGWNQWGSQGYPYPAQPHQSGQQANAAAPAQQPPAAQAQQPAAAAAAEPAPPAAAPAPAKQTKKAKKEAAAVAAAAAAAAAAEAPAEQTRKRPAEEDEGKGEKSKKKSKKEEEKPPAPKPPTKSHLKPPRQAPSAWQLFFNDEVAKAKVAAAAEAGTSPGGTPIHPKINVAQIAKDASMAYSQLGPDRKAYYLRKVEEGKIQYQKDLVAWQATLTPEDIKTENAFRAQQRKEGKSRKGNLKDPNAPKKPLSAYFLFLKGIRENDDLRNQVWGEETETTRQSVLAAERWRGLSDEEKRPYLQQAEKDKQEYEALRKVYEDDAAARARGENVPDRPQFHEIQSAVIDPPKSLLEPRKDGAGKDSKHTDESGNDLAAAADTTAAAAATITTVDPASTTFTVVHESTPDPDTTVNPTSATAGTFDPSLEIDEFHGFDDMDLTGLEGMTGHGLGQL